MPALNSQSTPSKTTSMQDEPQEGWKIRGSAGIPYYFHKHQDVLRWMRSRDDHAELEISEDGGATWTALSKHAAFKQHVQLTTEGSEAAPSEPAAKPSPSVASRPERAPAKTVPAAPPRRPKKKVVKRDPRDKAQVVALVLGSMAIIVLALIYQSFTSSDTIPNTPAGSQYNWVMSVVHGGSDNVTAEEIREHFASDILDRRSEEWLIDFFKEKDEYSPVYDLIDVDRAPSPLQLQTIVRTRGGDRGRIVITTSGRYPYKIRELLFLRENG